MENKTDLASVKLARPAQMALMNAGVTSQKKLADLTQKDCESLHGIGPNAVAAFKKGVEKKDSVPV